MTPVRQCSSKLVLDRASDPSPSAAFASSFPKWSARRKGHLRGAEGPRRLLSHASAAGTRSRAGREARGHAGERAPSVSSRLTPAAPTPPAVPVSACSMSTPEAAEDAGTAERDSARTPPTRLPRASATATAPPTRSVVRRLTPSLARVVTVSRVVVALSSGLRRRGSSRGTDCRRSYPPRHPRCCSESGSHSRCRTRSSR